jgi:hypothetical protein
VFDSCVQKASDERSKYNLSGVTYSDKFTEEAQVEGLLLYMRDNKFKSFPDMITKKGLEAAAGVLCRWPRPAELALLAKKAGEPDLWVYRLKVEVAPASPGKFVGVHGANLYALTERNGLLYAWLATMKDEKKVYLYLYGTTRQQVIDASKDSFVENVAVKGKKVLVRHRIGNTVMWEGEAMKGMNKYAAEFKPAPRKPAPRKPAPRKTPPRKPAPRKTPPRVTHKQPTPAWTPPGQADPGPWYIPR